MEMCGERKEERVVEKVKECERCYKMLKEVNGDGSKCM